MNLLKECPNKIYSFGENNQKLYDNTSKNALANMLALQESLVIFYTRDFDKIKFFIDFLIPQLSARDRPKCLIIYTSDDFNEIDIIKYLKYAWKRQFLDFSVVIDLFFLIYYYNPFNDALYRKQ